MDKKEIKKYFDCIVVGAGHAGCEAALAAARLGADTLVLATNLDTVAYCACNPSIGGTAKGQIVREIDALGGQMALCADKSMLQMRMLNRGKGAAVYSPRAQVDKYRYHENMKNVLENTKGLALRQGEATNIFVCEDDKTPPCLEGTKPVYCVQTAVGLDYFAPTVILCCGVYLRSKIITGQYVKMSGPNGFASADALSQAIVRLGHGVRRLKTGTPARINKNSVDFSLLEEQKGEVGKPFSYLNKNNKNNVSCYLTYSTEQTKKVILDNIEQAPIFTGLVEGVGPRYCPSIEDKVVRFADKQRHQIFLEPEGEGTNEYYVQGVSSSMPATVQYQIYRTIKGLENVQIMRDAYAIEYDCIDATQLYATLESKYNKGLFFAGQINGTSGYEEAAAQGIMAGINAARYICGNEGIVLRRNQAYIGVLIDDITTKPTQEPYRMMTSRAEYRLVLRQDNADERLTQIGWEIGLVDKKRYAKFLKKQKFLSQLREQLKIVLPPKKIEDILQKKGQNIAKAGVTVADLIKRPQFEAREVFGLLGITDLPQDIVEQIETEVKYDGYIQKERLQIEQALKQEEKLMPADIDYDKIGGLRIEARQKLKAIMPKNLGQASRISGVSPADINVLIVYLSRKQ